MEKKNTVFFLGAQMHRQQNLHIPLLFPVVYGCSGVEVLSLCCLQVWRWFKFLPFFTYSTNGLPCSLFEFIKTGRSLLFKIKIKASRRHIQSRFFESSVTLMGVVKMKDGQRYYMYTHDIFYTKHLRVPSRQHIGTHHPLTPCIRIMVWKLSKCVVLYACIYTFSSFICASALLCLMACLAYRHQATLNFYMIK